MDREQKSTKNDRLIQVLFDMIIILVIFLVLILVNKYMDPKLNGFYCNDTSIFYPRKPTSLSTVNLMLFSTFFPIVIMLSVEFINVLIFFKQSDAAVAAGKTGLRQYLVIVFHGLSLFMLGLGLTLLLTEVGKRSIGRLRPNFIDICKPDLSKLNCTSTFGTNIYYNYIQADGYSCRGKIEIVKVARLSFPSDHASCAFYGAVFTVIYLHARFVFVHLRLLRPFLQIMIFLVACVSSFSRVSDHHHHATDVLAGALLGSIIAFYVTFINGKVILIYACRTDYHDFDLKNETEK